MSVHEAALNRWPDILAALAGLTPEQLTDEHQPCPLCGGEDRYRFDDQDGRGSWFCNQCGGRRQAGGGGTGMDLLMRMRGWDFKTAAKQVEQFLGAPSTFSPGASADHRPPATVRSSSTKKPYRQPEIPPPDAAPPDLGRACAQWCYRDADGRQLFWIQRFDTDRGKIFVSRVWLDSRWHFPSKRNDSFHCEWPAPRPVYGLELIKQRPDARVLIVEGEKTCEAARLLLPQAIVLTWPNGSKAADLIDWSPLAGRDVVLWPDADDGGVAAMDRIGQALQRVGAARIRRIAPPADAAKGWDAADITDPAWFRSFLSSAIHPWTPPQGPLEQAAAAAADRAPAPQPAAAPEPPKGASADVTPPPAVGRNAYFALLGFNADGFFYQPTATEQVVRLSRSGHTAVNLVSLAPLSFWESLYPGPRNGPNWTAAAASLFTQQAKAGMFDPGRLRGRGAWIEGGRPLLHLGDKLLIDGKPARLNSLDSPNVYQRGSRLSAGSNSIPLTDEEGAQLLAIAEQFRWEAPIAGLLLAGWCAVAPFCGALQWRPHAWITAPTGGGKSAILNRFVIPLMGDMSLVVHGNTSEAGIRQSLWADALPVIFDEAEGNEKADQARMQSVLSLARVASSDQHGRMLKGSANGQAIAFTIRSCFLFSSIATGLKQGADRNRFAQLSLKSPGAVPKEEREQHWRTLDADLDRFVSHETGMRLQARIFRLLPVILESAQVFSSAVASHLDSQRLGDQFGILLAGAWALTSSHVPTPQQAYDMVRAAEWDSPGGGGDQRGPDEEQCLQRILSHQIAVYGARDHVPVPIAELAAVAAQISPPNGFSSDDAERSLRWTGIAITQAHELVISNTHPRIARILDATPWSNCWSTMLRRLPEVQATPVAVRFGSGHVARGTQIPKTLWAP